MDTYDLSLFARPSAQPFSIQAIGDPDEGPTGPFALLLRYADRLVPIGASTLAINDWKVTVAVYPNGNGDARWDLPDGGNGYLRSRGLDRDQLIRIVSALTARDPGAAIAGFDYSPATPTHLELVAEHMSNGVRGSITSYVCQVRETSFIYRISLLGGDPIFQYGGVIDRLVPLQVGYRQRALITIQGREDPTAPRVDDIVNADPEAWNTWLTRPLV